MNRTGLFTDGALAGSPTGTWRNLQIRPCSRLRAPDGGAEPTEVAR
jgi:hypothetical protein